MDYTKHFRGSKGKTEWVIRLSSWSDHVIMDYIKHFLVVPKVKQDGSFDWAAEVIM